MTAGSDGLSDDVMRFCCDVVSVAEEGARRLDLLWRGNDN